MKKILGILILTLICCINLIADLNDGLLVHYLFDGNADDESENGNDGILFGDIQLTEDRFGNTNSAFDFDGIDDYIQNNNNFDSITNNFSVSFWMKKENLWEYEYQKLIFFGTSTSNNGIQISQGYAPYPFYFRTDLMSSLIVTDYPALNSWLHIVVKYDGINVKMFIDNQLIGITPYSANIIVTTPLVIGWGYNSEFYNGQIDDIRIYDRPISDEEVQELYSEGGWPFFANFSSPEIAYIGEPIQFIDTSTGNPTTWEWDFENDGIYDSFIQNPTHTYNAEGLYSVKLKISNETFVDSLIKENLITVSYCPPDTVQNVQIVIDYPNANVSWDAVVENECGSAITPDGYIIRYNETATELDEDFYFLNFTNQLNYVHTFVAQYSPQMFYRVFAVKHYSREQIEYLESLNNSREKIKWSEVKHNLNEMRE